MKAKHMTFKELEKQEETLQLTCKCGWEGKATETYTEMHDEVVDFKCVIDLKCPKCDKKVLILKAKIGTPIFGFDNYKTSYKNAAEKLIYQNKSSDDPINVAGHICAELIHEYKHISPNKRELEYWESVQKELVKMRDMK